MISVSSLSYSFDQQKRLIFPDWVVQDEEDALILGPSGSGKTTLLHLLGGLLSPSTGIILLNGTKINEMASGQLDKFRGKHMGLVFQRPHLIKSLTVRENLRLALFLGNSKGTEDKIDKLLGNLGLKDIANRMTYQISQGQAQRVSIARAVVNEPMVICCDEPTANLDDKNCEKVISLLKEQARLCHASLVIATHDQRIKTEFKNKLVLQEDQTTLIEP